MITTDTRLEKMMRRYGKYLGVTFGGLTLRCISAREGDGRRCFGVFDCECGLECEYAIGRIVRGEREHCGCLGNRTPNLSHGMRYSPEYSVWQAIKSRCLNPKAKDYKRYGGAGVTMCQEWQRSFHAFFEHVGCRPDGTTIDRRDTTRGYEPGNVRWSTPVEQASNRRTSWVVNINGIEFDSVNAAARHFGVSGMTIVRWCDGYADPRRGERHRPPRNGCSRRRRYD